jgi:hypothetical protein
MAWWYSQNEERWNGPCSDREEAIELGRDEYPGEGFMVMEAETGDYDLRVDADTLLERIADRNEDRSDPDGDPPLHGVTPAQEKDLEAFVHNAIKRWARAHRIDIRAWCFTKQGNPESIKAEPETAETPAES